jgi:hypothetical protein
VQLPLGTAASTFLQLPVLVRGHGAGGHGCQHLKLNATAPGGMRLGSLTSVLPQLLGVVGRRWEVVDEAMQLIDTGGQHLST